MRTVKLSLKATIAWAVLLLLGQEAQAQPETPAGGQPRDALVAEVRHYLSERGIEPLPAPPPISDELFELGQLLAFDKILSGNRNIACLTCHHPALGTDDDRALPLGEGGSRLGRKRVGGPIIPRNAPALFNLHTYAAMFWDSRVERDEDGTLLTPAGDQLTADMVAALELGVVAAQALFPVTSREEMRGQPGSSELGDIPDDDFQAIWAALMARLGEVPEYVDRFESAYGLPFAELTFAHAANAIAAFEIRAFDTRSSPWDRFVAGDDDALGIPELRGAELFFEVGCDGCHAGSRFSDFEHHNTALAQFGPGKGAGAEGDDDFGREQINGDPADRYGFRTPPLFNVSETAPYGHAGQFPSLRAHIRHYVDAEAALEGYDIRRYVHDRALWSQVVDNQEDVLDGLAPEVRALGFAEEPGIAELQVQLLERFLQALTDPAAKRLGELVPESVPSGLPVAD